MIPKKIHYCWFGRGDKPKLAQSCIASWRKYCPDYEIIEWNEDNFNLDYNGYTRYCYDNRKWAFLSDFARLVVVAQHGGLYFDTDVEVINKLDDVLSKGNYLGVEQQNDEKITVAPGLGIGVCRENALFGKMIEVYSRAHFLNDDGTPCLKNIVEITTEQLQKNGLRNTPEIQTCCGFTIYPKDYFCPIDYDTRELVITENTRTIHHYAESWVPRSARFKNALRRIFGKRFITFLVNAKKKIRNA